MNDPVRAHLTERQLELQRKLMQAEADVYFFQGALEEVNKMLATLPEVSGSVATVTPEELQEAIERGVKPDAQD